MKRAEINFYSTIFKFWNFKKSQEDGDGEVSVYHQTVERRQTHWLVEDGVQWSDVFVDFRWTDRFVRHRTGFTKNIQKRRGFQFQ